MTPEIALLLGQDGLTNGAVYALLAVALVVVYAVTRVVFIPQGEFVAFGALTMAAVQSGVVPNTIWLGVAAGLVAAIMETWSSRHTRRPSHLAKAWGLYVGVPACVALLCVRVIPLGLPAALQILLTLAIIVPLGPIVYRVVFQPVAGASVLLLLIVAVALSFTLTGLGLLMFGAEGVRTEPISAVRFVVGAMTVSAQSLWIILAGFLMMFVLYLFFDRTLTGKALRATSVNRIGARIVGIRAEAAGSLSFTLAAAIGAVSGILLAPITTVYYDSGFLIGLKGFVGAIVGGLASYPIAVFGAVLVGLIEAFSSFYSSAFKEALVFTLILPVLVWRSLTSLKIEGDEE